jgi:hypothetical protein
VDTFALSTVRDSPELLASLQTYSASREAEALAAKDSSSSSSSSEQEDESSVLLLRILAAADYFTTDAALMNDVPPVDVDIILDAFLFNVVPRSLVHKVVWLAAVAVVGFFVARNLVLWFQFQSAKGKAAMEELEGEKKTQ